ncbi:hypothetical protein DERF_001851 [Dermatophagoides farinae]|uniref:Uncharacterized protein n=1 Tax=Dermatophagoides farinae TaxID=6954 RepID=A0A922L9U6_DERFA|nr:hypothetical protein DERF_001851 [Dermatophagoides farinae]
MFIYLSIEVRLIDSSSFESINILANNSHEQKKSFIYSFDMNQTCKPVTLLYRMSTIMLRSF